MSAQAVTWSERQTGSVDRVARVAASLQAHGRLQVITAAVADLRPHVLAGDQLGAAESLSELALRAVRLVVLEELTVLRNIVSGTGARGRDRALFRPPLGSFAALECFVRTELRRVQLLCTAFRGTRRDAYRAALRRARSLMQRLGQASDVGQFLCDGRARGDWPDLQALSIRLLATLAIRIDVDPDLPFLIIESPAARVSEPTAAEPTS